MIFRDENMNYSSTTAFSNTTDSYWAIVPSYTLALTVLSCVLSILGSAIIIITFFNLPEIQNFARKLLLSLTVADLFTAVGNLIGSVRYIVLLTRTDGCYRIHETDSVCIFQSFLTTFSSMASFFWTAIIAVHFYLLIQSEVPGMRTGLMLFGYQVLCWGVPGIITITASALRVLGSDNSVGTGSWCWIRSEVNNGAQVVWMIISGKGWEMLCYILTAGLYMLSKIKMWTQRRQGIGVQRENDMRAEDENYLYVPLVLYLLRLWGTVRFFLALTSRNIDSVHLDRAQTILLAFQGIGDSGQAFCNCILFCFCDRTVRNYLCSVICRRRSRISEEDDERTPIQV